MTAAQSSTIAALFYVNPPAINFARLVADLDAALAEVPHDRRALTWDCDDAAIVDLDAARIVLSWADRLPAPLPAALALSVGPGPGAGADPFAGRREAVARLIAMRIASRLPPDETLWDAAEGVMTAEMLDEESDRMHAALRLGRLKSAAAAAARTAPDAGRAADVVADAEDAPVRATAKPAATADSAEPPSAGAQPRPVRAAAATADDDPDLDRLMARMERELTAQRTGAAPAAPPAARPDTAADAPAETTRPAAPAEEAPSAGAAVPARPAGSRARARARAAAAAAVSVANDLPDLPKPALREAARIRAALYPPEPAEPERASTPARLAVGAMGTTLIFVAAPVGAALLTYNALRGADLGLTARAIALTGAALAFGDLPALQAFLSFV